MDIKHMKSSLYFYMKHNYTIEKRTEQMSGKDLNSVSLQYKTVKRRIILNLLPC